jgi:hypothetical protein
MEAETAMETSQALCEQLYRTWEEANRLGKKSLEEATRLSKLAIEKINLVHAALTSEGRPIDDGWEVVGEDGSEDSGDTSLSDGPLPGWSHTFSRQESPTPSLFEEGGQETTNMPANQADEAKKEDPPTTPKPTENFDNSKSNTATDMTTFESQFIGRALRRNSRPSALTRCSLRERAFRTSGCVCPDSNPYQESSHEDLQEASDGFHDVQLNSGCLNRWDTNTHNQ